MRVTAAYPNVNVKVVGTHSGISIGEDGPSQMGIEDIEPGLLAARLHGALARPTKSSMKALVRAAAEHVGPVFIRAGRAKAPVIYQPGPAIRHRQGR